MLRQKSYKSGCIVRVDDTASGELPDPRSDRVVGSTIVVRSGGQLKISPTAQIINSSLTVAPGGSLTVGDWTTIAESKIFVYESAGFAIGSNSSFIDSVARVRRPGAAFSVGDRTRINRRCSFFVDTSISIGDFCLFSADILCTDSQIHSLDWRERRQEILSWNPGQQTDFPRESSNIRSAPLTIESDCWLGRGASILVAKTGNIEGLRIGRGCVIGAGAVVKNSLPDLSLAVGVPAKVIRRLSEESSEF